MAAPTPKHNLPESSTFPQSEPLTSEWAIAVIPNLFGTRDQFCGRQFFHSRQGWGGVGGKEEGEEEREEEGEEGAQTVI